MTQTSQPASRWLTALPVYNEATHVASVLEEVQRYSPNVLAVDDGSTDGTGNVLAQIEGIAVVNHAENRGYGAALKSAFCYARRHQYDIIVTVDCDGQHEPKRIPQFVSACAGVDIVSGSRYLQQFPGDTPPPVERRRINELLTAELNARLELKLTDAFCGFKAYRVESLKSLTLTEDGYAMPLELWVEAARAKLRIAELPVPLIYLEEERSFGGALDDSKQRLAYYHDVLEAAIARTASRRAWAMCGESSQ